MEEAKRKPRGLNASEATERKRIAASQSFTEAEVNVMDAVMRVLLRGGDTKVLMRSDAAKSVAAKFARMKSTCERLKHLRERTEAARKAQVVCICTQHETSFDTNPQGHRTDCPCWGTELPHACGSGRIGTIDDASEMGSMPPEEPS